MEVQPRCDAGMTSEISPKEKPSIVPSWTHACVNRGTEHRFSSKTCHVVYLKGISNKRRIIEQINQQIVITTLPIRRLHSIRTLKRVDAQLAKVWQKRANQIIF